MSMHLVAALGGCAVAALATGVLARRWHRAPGVAAAAWLAAAAGLTVSLGAQSLGYYRGFGPLVFRAAELGGQVAAPVALCLGLAEVAARTTSARFAARLLLPALAVIALVVLGTDPLSGAAFGTSWRSPSTYYQGISSGLLSGVLAPAAVVAALLSVAATVLRWWRNRPGGLGPAPVWPAAVAALLLAVPGLSALLPDGGGAARSVSSVYVLLCLAAAVLVWLAGVRLARIRLAGLRHRAAAADPDASDEDGDNMGLGTNPYDQGDFAGPAASGNEGYRAERPDPAAGGYARPGGEHGGARYHADAHYRPGHAGSGQPLAGQNGRNKQSMQNGQSRANGRTGRIDLNGPNGNGYVDAGHREPGYGRPGEDRRRGDTGYPAGTGRPGGRHASSADGIGWRDQADGPDRRDEHARRAGPGDHAGQRAFGQISIYTLIEDRAAEFDDLAARIVGQVRLAEPGTLAYIVHSVPSAPIQRIVYAVYRDRSAYDAHRQQPHIVRFERDLESLAVATSIIELDLQRATVLPFPVPAEALGAGARSGHPGYVSRAPGEPAAGPAWPRQ